MTIHTIIKIISKKNMDNQNNRFVLLCIRYLTSRNRVVSYVVSSFLPARHTPKAPVVPELSRTTVMALTRTEQHIFACVSLRDCGWRDSCHGYCG